MRLRYPDLETFLERYAPNVTRGGIFLASRDPRPVGEVLRFEVLLRQGGPVISGEGRVTWVKQFNPAEPHRPYGMGVQFLQLDPASRPVLDRLLKRKEAGLRPSQAHVVLAAVPGLPERRPTEPIHPLGDLPLDSSGGIDDSAMRRTLDRARALAARTDDLSALLAPDPEEPRVTLAQALADLPRLVGGARRPGSGTFRATAAEEVEPRQEPPTDKNDVSPGESLAPASPSTT